TDSGASAGDILAGKKAWVNGEEVTGTVPAGKNVTGNDGEIEIAIPDGLYSGGNQTATAVDGKLISENIRSGVSIFGVSGQPTVVETEGATAGPEDIMTEKTAWVDGEEVIGTMPDCIKGEWGVWNNRLIDPDANVYTTVIIGNKMWTVQNLRTTKYADGTPIPHVVEDLNWEDRDTPAYCWYNNTDDQNFRDRYGALYNWYVLDTANARDIAPEGWRVPSDEDWYEMMAWYLGGQVVAGGKMKTEGTSDWQSPNEGATNSSGFSALPGGFRDVNGEFSTQGSRSYWWSSPEKFSKMWGYSIINDSEELYRIGYNKRSGFSVRLVRDLD
ncbi:MAG: fibrobacter succinogenes major paralogous domain-containing protein, partial [Fibrobacterota bacterium]